MDAHDPRVIRLAQAIAKAEGFGPPENLPTRINNPGDLELGDRGYGTQGGKTVFASVQEGWERLYHECWLMLSGNSHVYSPTASLLQIAKKYTGGDAPQAWAAIVAQEIGIHPLDTLTGYLSA